MSNMCISLCKLRFRVFLHKVVERFLWNLLNRIHQDILMKINKLFNQHRSTYLRPSSASQIQITSFARISPRPSRFAIDLSNQLQSGLKCQQLIYNDTETHSTANQVLRCFPTNSNKTDKNAIGFRCGLVYNSILFSLFVDKNRRRKIFEWN